MKATDRRQSYTRIKSYQNYGTIRKSEPIHKYTSFGICTDGDFLVWFITWISSFHERKLFFGTQVHGGFLH